MEANWQGESFQADGCGMVGPLRRQAVGGRRRCAAEAGQLQRSTNYHEQLTCAEGGAPAPVLQQPSSCASHALPWAARAVPGMLECPASSAA